VATAKAIEVFVFLGCVAMGILQMIALRYPTTVWNRFTGWLRTIGCPSSTSEKQFFESIKKFVSIFRSLKISLLRYSSGKRDINWVSMSTNAAKSLIRTSFL
jgi:hypothetical protein